MRPETRTRRAGGWPRTLAIAALALAIGAALGPAAATAASSIQKVLVTNSSASAVYVRPPSHQLVHANGLAFIGTAGTFSNSVFYTVPSNRWLVVTGVGATGYGVNPVGRISVHALDGSTDVVLPNQQVAEGGDYHLSTTGSGPYYFAPGAQLEFLVERDSVASNWYGEVYLQGYLTQQP